MAVIYTVYERVLRGRRRGSRQGLGIFVAKERRRLKHNSLANAGKGRRTYRWQRESILTTITGGAIHVEVQ